MSYRIQETDIDKASHVLGQSFIDYPIFKYILPDREIRRNNNHHFFNFLIRMAMSDGEVIAPSNNIEGVSIWVNPPKGKADISKPIKAGIVHLLLHVDIGAFVRFNEIGSIKRKARSRIITAPYYLLDVIGVDPKHQQRGYAQLMINSQLCEYDKRSIPCYLETSDPRNIPFYQQFGFQLKQQYAIHSINMYCMKRECMPSSKQTSARKEPSSKRVDPSVLE